MVKLIEEGFIDDGGQAGADPAGLHALLHNDGMLRLADALADCLHVERLQADEVDDLRRAQL